MLKMKEFFFEYERIKSGFTYNDHSEFFSSFQNKNHFEVKNHLASRLKGEKKEVVIKLISNINAKSTSRCLKYILREKDEKIELKNEFGKKVSIADTLKMWNLSQKESSRECWHLIFSIQEPKTKENFEKLEKCILEVMRANFLNHSFVFAKHSHQNNPHIHVVLNKNNHLTHKKIHFKTKEEIKQLFSTMRDDFAMALNYESLNYTASQKLSRLDKLVESYQEKMAQKPSIDHYTQILLEQLNFQKAYREKMLEKIKQYKIEQTKLRHEIPVLKSDYSQREIFMEKIKQIKLCNKKITACYRILRDHAKNDLKIRDEFVRFEKEIKPLLSINLNAISTLNYLDKKIGKNKLSKKQLERLNEIREYFNAQNRSFDDFYSPLTAIFKKNLSIYQLAHMLKEQIAIQNNKISTILISEIKNRRDFYTQKYLSGCELSKSEELKLPFILKEVNLANEVLKPLKLQKEAHHKELPKRIENKPTHQH